MKPFEVFEHTADVGGRIYGKDIKELFINTAKLLYFLAGAKQYERIEKVINIELSSETIEELLVKFLNELIYYMDVKKIGGKIKKLYIKKKGKMLGIHCEMTGKKISVKREIKAATYHNLKVKKEKDIFSSEIIFDV
ncbi:MAG: archease [Candidatus Omnitrophica bacterium]|nr:archease [Candidatus Omnitrophota bacterium]MCM8777858.1 archease [Candidatus Omnitrophota bacterium]